MATTDRPNPGEPGRPGKQGGQGEGSGRSGRGGEGGPGGPGGRGGGESGEPGGRGGEGGPGGAGRSYDGDDRVSRWLDWIVRIVAVVSLLLTGLIAGKVFRASQCQGRFNERTTAITPATNRERDTQRASDDAQDQLWLSIKFGDQSPEQRRRLAELITAYQRTLTDRANARTEADKARAAHPLPDCSPQ
jgi:hypothetical protein